jgi:hypothetical protein
VDELQGALAIYLLEPNSLWITAGYTLSALISSVALYDFGPFKSALNKKLTIFYHYTILAFFFAVTAFLMELTKTGFSLLSIVGFLLLTIKLFIAYFFSMILYKIVKDYLISFLKNWLGARFGKGR